MAGLLRGLARTAAVVGVATATRNAVNRRQAERNVQAYSNAVSAAQARRSPEPYSPPPQQYAPPPSPEQHPAGAIPDSQGDVITQLERLGALLAQGILTEQEFAVQKSKLLRL